jgi:hypothetical protein
MFRKVTVRVLLDDGRLLGQALVDDLKGMVTINPGTYKGPALIEIVGAAGGEYFDESIGTFLPFGAGQSLRALVAEISYGSANIGVTSFTEAATRYYLAQGGSLARLDAAAIRGANGVVQDSVNALLPASLRLTSLTRLPHLIGPGTSVGSIANTANGYYGVSLAGLALAARAFNPSSTRPAADMGAQLAADLADGVLDFIGVDGAPVAPAAQAMYSPAVLSAALPPAIDTAARRYGSPGLINALGVTPSGFSTWPGSSGGQPGLVQLQSNGDLLQAPGPGSVLARNVSSVGRTQGAGYAVRSDGSLLASGPNGSGQLGNGSTQPASGLVEVSGFGPGRQTATMAAGGASHGLARTSDGAVMAWGSNDAGQLGLAASVRVQPLPTAVPGAPAALSVAATSFASLLLTETGRVYAWGTGSRGELGLGDSLRLAGQPNVVAFSEAIVGLDCARHCLALTRGGKVFGWGPNAQGGVGTGGANDVYTPTDLGLAGIRAVAVDTNGASFALTAAGGLLGWGLDASGQSSARLSPLPFAASTPRMTSLYRIGQQVFARAQDGGIYLLSGGAAIPIGAGPAVP